jgi:hypothetical protein
MDNQTKREIVLPLAKQLFLSLTHFNDDGFYIFPLAAKCFEIAEYWAKEQEAYCKELEEKELISE